MKQTLTIVMLLVSGLALTACGQQNGQQDGSQNSGSASSQTGDQSAPIPSQQSMDAESTADGTAAMDAGAAESGTESAKAVAELAPTEGNKVKGTVNFTQGADGVSVTGEITGLTPGEHGFHVHANGDCSAPDGKSAGGHFNPGDTKHAAPTDEEHHEGDMGNITADADGVAKIDESFDFLKLGDGPESIIGKAIIVHGGADDLKSQPSGAAGPRVACGVIKVQGATGINSQQ